MRVIILFFCLMFAFNGFSQKVRERQVLFKIAPLALIDDFGLPAIQGGLEIPVAKNISWYNEFGIRYRKSIAETADTNFVTPGGYRVKSEVRYYFNNIKDKVNRRVPGLSKPCRRCVARRPLAPSMTRWRRSAVGASTMKPRARLANPAPQERAAVAAAAMQSHDQRPASRRVVVFRHIERERAALPDGPPTCMNPTPSRVGSAAARRAAKTGIAAGGLFEEEVADRPQVRGHRIEAPRRRAGNRATHDRRRRWVAALQERCGDCRSPHRPVWRLAPDDRAPAPAGRAIRGARGGKSGAEIVVAAGEGIDDLRQRLR